MTRTHRIRPSRLIACEFVALLVAASAAAASPASAASAAAASPASASASAVRAGAGSAPNSMASLGDSITRGFNACGLYIDCTVRSFGTGTNTSVRSHYERILAINPAISGHAYNDAESGADAADLPGQVDRAVSQGVQYVTILIGANDACADTEAGMTPVGVFRAYVDDALARLKAGLATARVLVISVPDLKRLWEVGKGNGVARAAWSLFGICQSMLSNPASVAQADAGRRDRVRQRVVDYNTELAQACAAYGPLCVFDGNAVFNVQFSLSQVSGWDYFHPNLSGQTMLASISYAAGFGW